MDSAWIVNGFWLDSWFGTAELIWVILCGILGCIQGCSLSGVLGDLDGIGWYPGCVLGCMPGGIMGGSLCSILGGVLGGSWVSHGCLRVILVPGDQHWGGL